MWFWVVTATAIVLVLGAAAAVRARRQAAADGLFADDATHREALSRRDAQAHRSDGMG